MDLKNAALNRVVTGEGNQPTNIVAGALSTTYLTTGSRHFYTIFDLGKESGINDIENFKVVNTNGNIQEWEMAEYYKWRRHHGLGDSKRFLVIEYMRPNIDHAEMERASALKALSALPIEAVDKSNYCISPRIEIKIRSTATNLKPWKVYESRESLAGYSLVQEQLLEYRTMTEDLGAAGINTVTSLPANEIYSDILLISDSKDLDSVEFIDKSNQTQFMTQALYRYLLTKDQKIKKTWQPLTWNISFNHPGAWHEQFFSTPANVRTFLKINTPESQQLTMVLCTVRFATGK